MDLQIDSSTSQETVLIFADPLDGAGRFAANEPLSEVAMS